MTMKPLDNNTWAVNYCHIREFQTSYFLKVYPLQRQRGCNMEARRLEPSDSLNRNTQDVDE